MSNHRNRALSFVTLAVLALLSGCATGKKPDPAFAPARPLEPKPPELNNGAIYQDGTGLRLFEDQRARRVGDILTITLVETTTASKSAATTSKKNDDISLTSPTLLGSSVDFNIPGEVKKAVPLARTTHNDLSVSAAGEREFTGSGASSQSNTLSGSIAVTVVEVLSNGNLVVRGEKIVGINEGDEYIQFTGIVRQQDIKSDNTVLSTYVANAQVRYGGSGAVADATSHGWLSKFFLAFWPF